MAHYRDCDCPGCLSFEIAVHLQFEMEEDDGATVVPVATHGRVTSPAVGSLRYRPEESDRPVGVPGDLLVGIVDGVALAWRWFLDWAPLVQFAYWAVALASVFYS